MGAEEIGHAGLGLALDQVNQLKKLCMRNHSATRNSRKHHGIARIGGEQGNVHGAAGQWGRFSPREVTLTRGTYRSPGSQ